MLDGATSSVRIRRIAVTAALLSRLLATPAGAATAHRHGFTWELGVGLGAIQIAGMPAGYESLDVGFEPHAISLGAFVTPRLALMWRWTSTYYFANDATGGTAQGVFGTQGLHLQYWVTRRCFVGGGVAGAALGNFIGREEGDPRIKLGLGLAGRAGYTIAQWADQGVSISFKALLGIFAGRTAVGEILAIEYQSY